MPDTIKREERLDCKVSHFQICFNFLFRLAERLLEKETLSLPDIVEILGPRPFDMKESLKEYLSELRERAVSDEKLTKEEKEAELEKIKSFDDSTKFDPHAQEESDDENLHDPANEATNQPTKEETKAESKEQKEQAEKKDEENKK